MNMYPEIENELSKTLRGHNLLQDNKDKWETLVKKYPSFDLLHLLYLKKVKEDEPLGFIKEVQKSSIHFSNPVWLEYLLNLQNLPAKNIPEQTHLEKESNEKISKMLEAQALSFQEPVGEHEELPVSVEAMHRIDYFESQGIRLEEQPGKQDQLEIRVKKFTDWLKDMKRINPHPVDLGSQEESSAQVEGFAAKSLETKEEVLTEAMAEVLIKQGKSNEAIHVYEKLSFLNPSKTTYFAAKIERLKQQ